jgi:hypothetical protein
LLTPRNEPFSKGHYAIDLFTARLQVEERRNLGCLVKNRSKTTGSVKSEGEPVELTCLRRIFTSSFPCHHRIEVFQQVLPIAVQVFFITFHLSTSLSLSPYLVKSLGIVKSQIYSCYLKKLIYLGYVSASVDEIVLGQLREEL